MLCQKQKPQIDSMFHTRSGKILFMEYKVTNRVAEKSNPSNRDCIQIEIFASNLLTKFTHFFVAKCDAMLHFTPYCITFILIIKIYRKMYSIIECSHTDKSIAFSIVACIQNRTSIGWSIILHPKCFQLPQLL